MNNKVPSAVMAFRKKYEKVCLIFILSLCLLAVICSNSACSNHFSDIESSDINCTDTLNIIIIIDGNNNFFIDGKEVLPPYMNKRYRGKIVLEDSSDIDLSLFEETFLNKKKELKTNCPDSEIIAMIRMSKKASVGSHRRVISALFANNQPYDFKIIKSD